MNLIPNFKWLLGSETARTLDKTRAALTIPKKDFKGSIIEAKYLGLSGLPNSVYGCPDVTGFEPSKHERLTSIIVVPDFAIKTESEVTQTCIDGKLSWKGTSLM